MSIITTVINVSFDLIYFLIVVSLLSIFLINYDRSIEKEGEEEGYDLVEIWLNFYLKE